MRVEPDRRPAGELWAFERVVTYWYTRNKYESLTVSNDLGHDRHLALSPYIIQENCTPAKLLSIGGDQVERL